MAGERCSIGYAPAMPHDDEWENATLCPCMLVIQACRDTVYFVQGIQGRGFWHEYSAGAKKTRTARSSVMSWKR